jgi:TPR repeat protein
MIPAVNGKALRLLLAVCLLLSGRLFAAEADDTDPAAQFERAIQVMTGDGVRKSEAEGIRILKRSAKAGYLPAQNHLAICYQTGTGFIFRSKRKAETWFLAAAEAGYLPAFFNLAQLYLTTDEKHGEAKARPWLEKAANYVLSERDGDESELFAETKATACTLLGQQLLEAEDKALWPEACAYFEAGANPR